MDVQLPDGTIVKDVPEGTTRAELAAKLKANGRDVPREWLTPPQEARPSLLNPVGEAITSIGTGALAGTASVASGALGAALPGPRGQGADWMRRTQEQFTYAPRSEQGKQATAAATAPLEKLSEFATYVGHGIADHLGPEAGALTESFINVLPTLLAGGMRVPYGGRAAGRVEPTMRTAPRVSETGPRLGTAPDVNATSPPVSMSSVADARPEPTGAPGAPSAVGGQEPAVTTMPEVPESAAVGKRSVIERITDKSRDKYANFIENKTWADARKEGFVVVDPGLVTKFGGRSKLRQEAINRNQEMGDKVAKREAGLTDKEPLDHAGFEAARARIAAPYDEVTGLSPMAKVLWNAVREKRREATRQYDHYYKGDHDPAVLDKADKATATAERMEAKIHDIAAESGNTDLVSRLKAARVQFAKNYQVEKATNVGNGHVDLGMIGRDVQKKPMANSGALAVIGKFARGFSDYVGKVRDIPESEPNVGVGLSMGGLHGYLFERGLPLVGGGLRSLALSDLMQNRPGLRARLLDTATSNPWAFGVAPAVGLRSPEE